ncbi:MAG TPA: hypothetical protein VFR24_08100, partial [Candidatus Angelobacter sp.]|nr:hypothetical protein [Candidatus Angelobacter sp.]
TGGQVLCSRLRFHQSSVSPFVDYESAKLLTFQQKSWRYLKHDPRQSRDTQGITIELLTHVFDTCHSEFFTPLVAESGASIVSASLFMRV